MGVMLQGFFFAPGRIAGVPSPHDGDRSIPFWWDHLASQADTLVAAIKSKGGKVTAIHLDTDHSYSDHRIALESIVITWLSGLN